MSTTKRSAEQIVLDFIGAFRESWPKDLDVALAPLAEDAYYQLAVPSFAPVKGRAAIKAELELMQKTVTGQRHDMKAVAASGNTVFTERCDWSFRNERWVPIPLVAVFVLNAAGQIAEWREYLDPGHAAKLHGMSMEDFRASLAA